MVRDISTALTKQNKTKNLRRTQQCYFYQRYDKDLTSHFFSCSLHGLLSVCTSSSIKNHPNSDYQTTRLPFLYAPSKWLSMWMRWNVQILLFQLVLSLKSRIFFFPFCLLTVLLLCLSVLQISTNPNGTFDFIHRTVGIKFWHLKYKYSLSFV